VVFGFSWERAFLSLRAFSALLAGRSFAIGAGVYSEPVPMAQIRVEEKRSGLGWLWALIVLVVVALMAWYLVTNRGAVSTAPAAPAAPAAPKDSARTSMRAPDWSAPDAADERVDWVTPASVLGAKLAHRAA
jgi:hypothetical protein